MLATDAMVTTLARNKRFQYFALRIDGFIRQNEKLVTQQAEEFTKKGEQILKDPEMKRRLQQEAEQAATKFKNSAVRKGFSVARFVRVFKDEVAKDFGGGGR
jgi:hypothetical protein